MAFVLAPPDPKIDFDTRRYFDGTFYIVAKRNSKGVVSVMWEH